MEILDLVVIGAGWSGLAALKTYHQVHPSATLCLLESASSVGGVWAKPRLWDGLKSNNMRGTYEFSDFPMDDSFGVKPGEHIPGHIIQSYLERYAEHFGVAPLIRLNSRVQVVDHDRPDGSWALTYLDMATGETKEVLSRKLIIATGITSQPYRPAIRGEESFDRPLFHSSELPKYHQSVLRQPSNHIVVLGGTKSAWDAVYTAATAGATVDWIIRDNGHGPVWMAPPYVTPLHRWLEKLVTTRLLSWFSPCIWTDPVADGGLRVRSFLHGTWLGRKITDGFWSLLANDVVTRNRLAAHPETAKLTPWISPFWVASGLSILNYPTNFFDLVTSGQVRVHIDHIAHLSAHTVHLATSGTLDHVDALVVASGWKPGPEIEFRPAATLPRDLGFPNAPDALPASLVAAADQEILARFPRLATQPVHASPAPYAAIAPDAQTGSQARHPYRLARFLVPPTPLGASRTVAFMGVAMTINTALVVQTQALWIAAYFAHRLPLLPHEPCPPDLRAMLHKTAHVSPGMGADLLWETALHSQFGVHRYPGGLGRRNPDFVFDVIPYVDLLLRDLGVRRARKQGMKQWFEPHGMEDYGGVVEEWMSGN
ncbi:hypothetical protein ARAM_006497 [Aspergillus rambellii]|uniref:FAD/NAD(P)-binding domain-containing protein n=1 Tax=Aspergillus rambellii TaxID=308745 RepID=A0A0F8XC40_9EURO|nr:hypothetical protein ARAM_006497 [Aspergillus rambellii]